MIIECINFSFNLLFWYTLQLNTWMGQVWTMMLQNMLHKAKYECIIQNTNGRSETERNSLIVLTVDLQI